jgi:dolichol-phosphate mannosyltransferase
LQMKILVVIPTFGDAEKTVKVLNRFKENMVDEVCLVVDNFAENDLSILQKAAFKSPIPIHVITNTARKGIGHAIKQGIGYGIGNQYDIAVVLAGNNKDDPREINRVIDPIKEGDFDYVQGSRFLPGGKHVKTPFFRSVFSKIYPFAWTLLTNFRCTDVTNGFRAYKLKILKDARINIWQDWLDGYQLEYYIHYKVLTLGYKVCEVPISKVYSHRYKGGYSKISPFRDWWTILSPLIYLKLGIKN